MCAGGNTDKEGERLRGKGERVGCALAREYFFNYSRQDACAPKGKG
jgi:hypothetical protein